MLRAPVDRQSSYPGKPAYQSLRITCRSEQQQRNESEQNLNFQISKSNRISIIARIPSGQKGGLNYFFGAPPEGSHLPFSPHGKATPMCFGAS